MIVYLLGDHGNKHSGYAVYPCFTSMSPVPPCLLTFRHNYHLLIQKLTKQAICPVCYTDTCDIAVFNAMYIYYGFVAMVTTNSRDTSTFTSPTCLTLFVPHSVHYTLHAFVTVKFS